MPEISDEGLEETKSDNDEASDSDRALVDIIKRFTSSIYIEPSPVLQTIAAYQQFQGWVLHLQTVFLWRVVPLIRVFPVKPDPTTRPRLRRKEGCKARIKLFRFKLNSKCSMMSKYRWLDKTRHSVPGQMCSWRCHAPSRRFQSCHDPRKRSQMFQISGVPRRREVTLVDIIKRFTSSLYWTRLYLCTTNCFVFYNICYHK